MSSKILNFLNKFLSNAGYHRLKSKFFCKMEYSLGWTNGPCNNDKFWNKVTWYSSGFLLYVSVICVIESSYLGQNGKPKTR